MQELTAQRPHPRYTRSTCSSPLCPRTFDPLSPLIQMFKADDEREPAATGFA